MRFLPVPIGPMLMSMMLIMGVRVCVFHADVATKVLMVLGQMQPHPCAHMSSPATVNVTVRGAPRATASAAPMNGASAK